MQVARKLQSMNSLDQHSASKYKANEIFYFNTDTYSHPTRLCPSADIPLKQEFPMYFSSHKRTQSSVNKIIQGQKTYIQFLV